MWRNIEVPVAGIACGGLLTLMVCVYLSIAGDSTRATITTALLRVFIASPPPLLPLLQPAPPRSLLVVQGAWRSFDRVVDGLLANVIAPNAPCDVVLALDWMREEDTRAVLAKLRPHVTHVLYPSDTRREGPELPSAKEFSQLRRALDYVNASAYTYIMKARTDLAVMVPFDFATAAGRSPRFSRAFARFVAAAQAITTPHPVRPCEALSMWVYSFGIDIYAHDARLVATRGMVWAPLTNAAVTPGLQRALHDACVAGWGGDAASDAAGWAFLARSDEIASIISTLFTDHHVMLLAGSTWLSWGASEDFLRVYSIIHSHFGRFNFRDLPPPWQNLSVPTWGHKSEVTESHVRISHLVSGVSLVEVHNRQDFEYSFSWDFPLHCRTWAQLQGDPLAVKAGIFLLRGEPGLCNTWWHLGNNTMQGVWPPSPSSTPSPSPPPSPESEALAAPPPPKLPAGWAEYVSRGGRTYYFHAASGESTFERPGEGMPPVEESDSV